ncbi:copper chaperone PCu(A)C [Streptomyces sp. PCS3-D2]|uniref:copper chaperone PCu(A)C n=1 Tax=Streptomyces sp. PCS3-D2 TaxID=1460244 RepID=UPI0004470047|nr:copper chaperone PCu(A)C [Streptomyces sp. PCS3-D2]WKV70430.1 copper chaperone PCu(A)C [Streptomyces sp. PCS3-D2]
MINDLLRKVNGTVGGTVRRTVRRAAARAVKAVAERGGSGRRGIRDGLFAALVPVTACLVMLVALTAWTRAGAAGSPARIDVGVGQVFLPHAGEERTTAVFRIANTGGSDDQLVSVSSPTAYQIVLNRHELGGTGDATRAVASADIPAGTVVHMTPATLDLTVAVKTRREVGELVPFVLHFRRSGPVDAVAFVVRPAG